MVDFALLNNQSFLFYRRPTLSNAFGIDIGTENLKIYSSTAKQILNIKNTIAIINKDQMYSYGDNAYLMHEKAPEMIEVSFPMNTGVIADFDNMQAMLFEVLENDLRGHIKGSDVILSVPCDITEVEKKAFSDLFTKTKNKPRTIKLCEKPLADALGMGLDITQPTGYMVIDLGAATTEISVISLGGLVISEILNFSGRLLDENIVTYMRREHNLVIGQKSGKLLKENIGSAIGGRTDSMTVVGRDVVSGLPVEMQVNSSVVYESIKDSLETLCTDIKLIIEKIPPELARDVKNDGIYITGGTSQLQGIAELIASVTGITVNIAEEPADSAARGIETLLYDNKFNRYAYSMRTRIFR